MAKLTLRSLRSKIEELILKILQGMTKKVIVGTPDLINAKITEFQYGLNPDRSDIGEYAPTPAGQKYRLFKLQLNPFAQGKVDLILTGATARGLEVVSLGNSKYLLESTDAKWDDLKAKYGDQIRLINEDEWKDLQRYKYAPELIKAMKKRTGL